MKEQVEKGQIEGEKSVFERAFKLYSLKDASISDKEKIRKLINRRLGKEYPDRTWDELSEYEKAEFLCITIRQPMLTHYIKNAAKEKKIADKIDAYLRDILHEAQNDLKRHNDVASLFSNTYFDPDATPEQNKIAYRIFCDDMHKLNNRIPIPDFEEWVEQNRRSPQPLRIYDYVMDYYDNPDDAPVPSQSMVDHVILHTLLRELQTPKKLFKEITNNMLEIINYFRELDTKDNAKLNGLHEKIAYTDFKGITVNIEKINECLSYLDEFDIDVFDDLLMEVDPDNKKMSVAEQKRIIARNIQCMKYKRMLEEYDFLSD